MNNLEQQSNHISLITNLYREHLSNANDIYQKLDKKVRLKETKEVLANMEVNQVYGKKKKA